MSISVRAERASSVRSSMFFHVSIEIMAGWIKILECVQILFSVLIETSAIIIATVRCKLYTRHAPSKSLTQALCALNRMVSLSFFISKHIFGCLPILNLWLI